MISAMFLLCCVQGWRSLSVAQWEEKRLLYMYKYVVVTCVVSDGVFSGCLFWHQRPYELRAWSRVLEQTDTL
jgi:hypothetical protein